MSKKSKKGKEDIEEQDSVEGAEAVNEQGAPENLETKVSELQDALLRTRADFDNFRKRTQRDIADTRAFSKISTVEELLPIIDTFKMAMQASNADNADLATLLAGLNMIQNQFNQAFSSLGIDEISATGTAFDPNSHEAVSEQFSDEVEEGIVISQHRCGYKVGERLIRAATVIVSKGTEPEVSDDVQEETVEE